MRHVAAGALARARGAVIGAAVIVLIGATTVVIDPNRPGAYPTCPFRAFTGLDCPGCGSLRSMRDLAHGDLVGALDHNALLVGVLLFATLRAVWGLVRPDIPAATVPRWVPRAVVVGLMLWTVARNLPVAPFTFLAA